MMLVSIKFYNIFILFYFGLHYTLIMWLYHKSNLFSCLTNKQCNNLNHKETLQISTKALNLNKLNNYLLNTSFFQFVTNSAIVLQKNSLDFQIPNKPAKWRLPYTNEITLISSTKQSSSFTIGRLFTRGALSEGANSSISFNQFMNTEQVRVSATIENNCQKYSHLSLMLPRNSLRTKNFKTYRNSSLLLQPHSYLMSKDSERKFLLVGILSSPSDLEMRNAVRETWGSRIQLSSLNKYNAN